jgi:hypothetical protein
LLPSLLRCAVAAAVRARDTLTDGCLKHLRRFEADGTYLL